jgi:glycosyltransferase involved in cell wall biosynthesis
MTLRILHISTRLILGGSQENTILSCKGQARAGHEVHLAFGPIFGPEGSMLDRVQSFNSATDQSSGQCSPVHDDNIPVPRGGGFQPPLDTHQHLPIQTHEIPHLVREVSPAADLRALRQLQTLIERINPDIVHTHSSKAGILGRIAAWKSNPRPGIVHTVHGPPFMPVEGSPLAQLRTRALNAAYTLAERHAARRCHVIVSVADAMTEQFFARGIGEPGQFVTVRSGMDLDPYLNPPPDQTRDAIRTSLNLATGDFVIGTVARLAEHKGHDDILDALADDLRDNTHWKLLWVGDGWWAERLADRIESLGLTPQVVRTGLVAPERVPGLIRAMDILCHPSCREGLPRTVPQALLCGVCPVAYDVDGTGEACRDEQTGRLVPPGDVAGLRDAVVSLAQDPARRHALAERGRDECIQAFDARVMVARLEEVYARAVQM